MCSLISSVSVGVLLLWQQNVTLKNSLKNNKHGSEFIKELKDSEINQ